MLNTHVVKSMMSPQKYKTVCVRGGGGVRRWVGWGVYSEDSSIFVATRFNEMQNCYMEESLSF